MADGMYNSVYAPRPSARPDHAWRGGTYHSRLARRPENLAGRSPEPVRTVEGIETLLPHARALIQGVPNRFAPRRGLKHGGGVCPGPFPNTQRQLPDLPAAGSAMGSRGSCCTSYATGITNAAGRSTAEQPAV